MNVVDCLSIEYKGKIVTYKVPKDAELTLFKGIPFQQIKTLDTRYCRTGDSDVYRMQLKPLEIINI